MVRGLIGAALVVVLGASVSAPAAAGDQTSLVLLAASNTRKPISDLIASYQASHPGIAISPTYVGSKTAMKEVAVGVQVDVVVVSDSSANGSTGIEKPAEIFRNRIGIMVSPGGASKIHDARDLAKSGVTLVCGTSDSIAAGYAASALKALSYGPAFDKAYATNCATTKTDDEQIVAALHGYDAALVFETDASMPGAGTILHLPVTVTVNYIAASVKASTHSRDAKDFAAFLAGPEAAAVYRKYGHEVAK